MKRKITQLSLIILVASLLLAACGSPTSAKPTLKGEPVTSQLPVATQQNPTPNSGAASLGAYQSALENIYTQVNPSVVSIRVVQKQDAGSLGAAGSAFPNIPGFPHFFGTPGQGNDQPAEPQYSQALGSGFVWNKDGYIVTNNHVVSGADKIEVKFADGTTLSAKLVGADPDSDLTVVKVDNPGFDLTPIAVNSSGDVKVGQVAVAIGNPFGLENTMTVGIVSALGRTLPASEGSSTAGGATYTIPDIIQTDASINPGNSGGPLVDDQGALIGVNTAIASASQSNSGVGFAIPATIVSQVVPELIKNGTYQHPYLGISGLSLTPDLAKAMNLEPTQRGALVEEILPGGPSDKAGLRGSDKTATIDGQQINVGGDVITGINGSAVKTIEDVIAYLADHTQVGQTVKLTFLRDGKEQNVEVTLEARPSKRESAQGTPSANAAQGAWLGIAGQPLTAEINKEMNLPETQTGVLVEQVQAGSPADTAGLQGSFKPVLINGQRVLVGGDIITAIDGKTISAFEDLKSYIASAQPDQQVTLTILRDGKEQTLTVTLAQHP
jgi:S1-C subfamily serine protease